jgi:hypothetical protein
MPEDAPLAELIDAGKRLTEWLKAEAAREAEAAEEGEAADLDDLEPVF